MEFVSVFCKNELLHYFVSASTSNFLGIVSNYRRYRKRNNCARLVLINIHFCKKKKRKKEEKKMRFRVKIDVNNSIRNTERGPAFSQISLEKRSNVHFMSIILLRQLLSIFQLQVVAIYKIHFYS